MDARVVGGLEHDAVLGRVHLVYAKRSIASNDIAATTLFPHPVSHEKCLVSLLSSEPIWKMVIMGSINLGYLHSIDSLGWRLTLGSSKVLLCLLRQAIGSQRIVGHCVFFNAVLLQIRHHISQSRLRRRFGSLLLYLVHLF